MAKFEIYKDTKGEYRAHLKAANGEIICWTEGYTSKQNVEKALQFIQANAAHAVVDDLTE